MNIRKQKRQHLTITILSLSLLTVMAGAAVAPALNTINAYFSDEGKTFTQMIISIPSLFIVLMSFFFPVLCRHFKSKTLLMSGLILYVTGGSIAGIFSNIWLVLLFRSFVGIAVGIIMPMSTGLLSFYYTRDKQDKLMGYSSAMNQMGGVIATLLAGLLASISWRLSFLVYLMGLVSIILCFRFLPNERISEEKSKKEKKMFKRYYTFIIAIFLLMLTFFIYPTVFSIEASKEGIIPQYLIAVIMAGTDLIAFLGGLFFVHIKNISGHSAAIVAPVFFASGYALLWLIGGWTGAFAGSAFIGLANGFGIPFIISSASQKAGKSAAVTIMPMLTMSLYLAQFVTPLILSLVSAAAYNASIHNISYITAFIPSILFLLWSFLLMNSHTDRHSII